MHPARTRRITTLGITAAASALAIATALPALADPGNGNGGNGGNGNGNPPSSPPGQAKQSASPAPSSSSNAAPAANPTPTQSPTHVPPGQAKKPSGGTNANPGKANGAGNGGGKGHGHAANGNATKSNATKPNHVQTHGKGNNGTGSGHNPPGNNGTVKIHAVPGDPGHHNVPHPGCSFAVDFWGFDQGQTLTVSFTGQAPTGAGVPVSFTAPDGTSVTSPDPAGGGNDPDGELVFTPTASELSALGAPAKQGYHVRLTVNTGQGGGHKYKVFWISPCAVDTTTPTASTPAPTGAPTLSAAAPAVKAGSWTAVRGTAPKSMPNLQSVRAAVPTRVTQASRPLSSLPFTGANLSTLITSGALALLAGIFLRAAVRRRRRMG
jgi:hypothetical protein